MPACPDCSGRGWLDAFVHRGAGCELDSIDCDLCSASGKISEETAERLAEGRRRRDRRIAAGRSVRQEAAILGITPIQLGRLERGRP